ncbi:MAG: RNA 2',3'-cyclic phosphodiesterase [Anaerolineae bacterium]
MEQIRSFVAIELDESVAAGLAEVQKRLKGQAVAGPLRWVAPRNIHLTLKFLGNIPAARVDEIQAAMAEACQGLSPFQLTFGGLGCFPGLARPRVVWVGVEDKTGTLTELQGAVERNLKAIGFPPEGRPFSPHLTLARVRKPIRSGQIRKLGGLIQATTVGQIGQMTVEEVSLMRSDLRPTGAVYTRLAAVTLKR